MLKVKSVRTVGFVGNDDLLVKELTCPFAKTKQGNCFYYKSALYRVENVDDACVRVVVFSAVELYCGFEKLLEMCENPKSVVYITDCKLSLNAILQFLQWLLYDFARDLSTWLISYSACT